MTREDFIESIISNIDDKFAKIEVKNELEAHLDDRIAFYTDAGYSYDYALEKAIERMGNAEELSEKLSGIHNTEKYRKLAYVFTVLYGLGAILGLVLTVLYHITVIELSDHPVLPCICSSIIFLIASLGFYYSQKSLDDGNLILFSGVSVFNLFAAPITFIPCGFSILSLLFEFPCALYEADEFDYFYYPFEYSVFDFFINNDTLHFIISIVLWILMCAFALFPMISGTISFKSFLNNKDKLNLKFAEKAKRYGVFLIILSIIGVVSISAELGIESAAVQYKNIKMQTRYDFDFDEAWNIYNSITLPVSFDKAYEEAKQYGSDFDEEDYYLLQQLDYYENYWCSISFENTDFKAKKINEHPKYFNEAYFINNSNPTLENEEINRLQQLKIGTTVDDLWNIVSPKYIGDCEIIYDDSSEKTLTKIYTFYYKNSINSITLTYENGKLKETIDDIEVYGVLD